MKPFEKSLAQVKKYIELQNNLAFELAKTGEPIVHSNYDYVEGNTKEYITVIEQKPNEIVLSAVGDDVCFREFGAGVDTASDYPMENTSGLPPIEPGSWSKEHAQQFTSKGYWYYKGEKYEGIYPTKGMYYASLTMRERLPQLVKEILND